LGKDAENSSGRQHLTNDVEAWQYATSLISSIICPSGPDVEPQGQRNRERLWNIWEHLATGFKEGHKNDCTHMGKKAQDRRKWRNIVGGLCSRRSNRQIQVNL